MSDPICKCGGTTRTGFCIKCWNKIENCKAKCFLFKPIKKEKPKKPSLPVGEFAEPLVIPRGRRPKIEPIIEENDIEDILTGDIDDDIEGIDLIEDEDY